MKRILSVFTGALLGLGSLVGAAESAARTTLLIKGMTCGGCVAVVKLQLKKTEGVSAYEVSLEKGEAQVTYSPARTDPKKIAESVSRTGFQASVKEDREDRKDTPRN